MHRKHAQEDLKISIHKGDVAGIKRALRHGANPTTALLGDTVALYDENITRILLEHGAMQNASPELKSKFLSSAVHCGMLEIVRLALDLGADINERCRDTRFTPLMEAIWFSDNPLGIRGRDPVGIVRLLIERGADLTIVKEIDWKGRPVTALSIAKEKNHSAIIDLLEDALIAQGKMKAPPPDASRFWAAVSDGNLARAKKQVERGLDVTSLDKEERVPRQDSTPLILAASLGRTNIVRYLIQECGVKTHYNEALQWAACSGRVGTVRFLLEMGADPNARMDKSMISDHMPTNLLERVKKSYETYYKSSEKGSRYLKIIGILEDIEKKEAATWTLLRSDVIAHVETYPALDKRVTEIFNMTSEERLTVVENLTTGATSSTTKDSITTLEKTARQELYDRYWKLRSPAA